MRLRITLFIIIGFISTGCLSNSFSANSLNNTNTEQLTLGSSSGDNINPPEDNLDIVTGNDPDKDDNENQVESPKVDNEQNQEQTQTENSIVDENIALERPPQDWFFETQQENVNTVKNSASNRYVSGNRWGSDTLNNAYIGANAWGFGGYAGGTNPLTQAFVRWSYQDNSDRLRLRWFVGGYHRNFSGKPEQGWYYNNAKGGNDVKAYPRMGIGSASGQPYVTSGSPTDLPTTTTAGVKTIDQYEIKKRVGLPVKVADMPEIDIHVDVEFSGGSDAVTEKDKYGNYFFAVDSYFHDIGNSNYVFNNSFVNSLNAINDSSGEIYGTKMSSLKDTTKRWAMMIWYHKSAYFETSGGIKLNNNQPVVIDGAEYFVRYKIETASNKKFKYISFVKNRESTEFAKGGIQPVIRYKRFVDFLTDGKLQQLLDAAGNLEDVDGVRKRIIAPSKQMVLSDVNLGVEILSNPDTESDRTPRPVTLDFKKLYFHVHNVGRFGFSSTK